MPVTQNYVILLGSYQVNLRCEMFCFAITKIACNWILAPRSTDNRCMTLADLNLVAWRARRLSLPFTMTPMQCFHRSLRWQQVCVPSINGPYKSSINIYSVCVWSICMNGKTLRSWNKIISQSVVLVQSFCMAIGQLEFLCQIHRELS